MKYIYYLIAISLSLITAKGQVPDSTQDYSSYEGTHFYVGFMQNEIDVKEFIELRLFITTNIKTQVKVTIPDVYPIIYNYNIDPDDVLEVDIPDYLQVVNSETPLKLVVEVNSDEPVTVYAFNSQMMTSDAAIILPVSQWGTEYVAMCMPNDVYQITGPTSPADSLDKKTPRSSEFMVIAAENNTTVSIWPTAITWFERQRYQRFDVNLMKGECYLVKSYRTPKWTGDLSGTIVRSDKPVGFVTGHIRTSVPQTLGHPFDSKDHLYEMAAPTDKWGRYHITVPFEIKYTEGEMFRIAGIHPNTLVIMESASGRQQFVLENPGDVHTIMRHDEPTIWRSSHPVQIAQMITHAGGINDNVEYDPSMVLAPPVEQFVSRAIFHTPGNSRQNPNQYLGHKIAVVAEEKALATLKLDDKLVKDLSNIEYNKLPNTDYHWAHVFLDTGKHEIKCTEGAFSGILYGFGHADSYAFVLGSSLKNPNITDTTAPVVNFTEKCGKVDGEAWESIDSFNTGLDFFEVILDSTFNYQWKIDTIYNPEMRYRIAASPLDMFSDGRIMVEIRDRNGNGYTYEHYFDGYKISHPLGADFPDTDMNSRPCKDFHVTNNSVFPLHIESIVPRRDGRLDVQTDPPLPADLVPGDSLKYTICFEPGMDSTQLMDTVVFAYDCDVYTEMEITGNVVLQLLVGQGHDFGDIRLTETDCDSVWFVNAGNHPVKIDSVTFDRTIAQFDIDTTGLFPMVLQPGDTLFIPVCFTPDSKIDYSIVINSNSDLSKPLSVIVTGRGVAPEIPSLIVDWGDRRVGTVNDTTVWLKNIGDASASVSFSGFTVVSTLDGDTNPNVLSGIDGILGPADSIRLDLEYSPDLPEPYNTIAEYEVDWLPHSALSVELIGNGTLPEIETFDVAFDTTVIYNRRDTNALLIKAGGNEPLHIDRVEYLRGDIDEFEIDLEVFKNIDIPFSAPSSTVSSAVSYVPRTLGKHELILGVVHDANPDYRRSTAEIRLSGISIPADTMKTEVELIAPDGLWACVEGKYEIKLSNTGNVDLVIEDVFYDLSGGILSEWETIPSLPVDFPVEGTKSWFLNITAERGQSGVLTTTAEFFWPDSNSRSQTVKEAQIDPQSVPIMVVDRPKLYAFPGDTTELVLTGEIPYATDGPIDFNMYIGIDQAFFLLINKNYKLRLTSASGEKRTIPIDVVQNKDKLIVQSEEEFDVSEWFSWEIELSLRALLHNKLEQIVEVQVSSDRCFDPDSSVFDAQIEEVCVFNLRPIKLIANLPSVMVYPNPVQDEVKLDVYLPEKDIVNIYLYDGLGRIIQLTENLNLEKGHHSLIFNLDFLQNGAYVLLMKTRKLTENSLFIISR